MTAEPIRQTVSRKEGFVVFLIGSRLNHWWALPMMWAVARAMGRMMNELVSDPASGLLPNDPKKIERILAVGCRI